MVIANADDILAGGAEIGNEKRRGRGEEIKIVIVTTTGTGVIEGSGGEIEMMIMTGPGVEITIGNNVWNCSYRTDSSSLRRLFFAA